MRLRDHGIEIGTFAPGPLNAITDVEGVLVGHATVEFGAGSLEVGVGPARTGATVILPNGGDIFHERVTGGGFVLNGAGELSGLTQVMEWGLIETPIALTNSLSVGTCSEAIIEYMLRRHATIGQEHDVVLPLVGECDDSCLNDVAGRHVRREHVLSALDTATGGPVVEGNVGAGTGMMTCDLAGGIGTSSRRVPNPDGPDYTVGVLVLSNFGVLEDLRIDGFALGRALAREGAISRRYENYGSIITVVATDVPLLSSQLNRVAKRAALGIGRVGSVAAHGSGEIVLAFSTTNGVAREDERLRTFTVLSDRWLDPVYRATIEATEEAILNAIVAGREVIGRDDHIARGYVEWISRFCRR